MKFLGEEQDRKISTVNIRTKNRVTGDTVSVYVSKLYKKKIRNEKELEEKKG